MLTGPSILKIAYGVNVLSLCFPLPCFFGFWLADVKCILPEKSFDEEDQIVEQQGPHFWGRPKLAVAHMSSRFFMKLYI